MLMPKKRFQFNQTYLYGSSAFIVGFGVAIAALVHFAPIRVPNANIATTPESSSSEQTSTETTKSADVEIEEATPAQTNAGQAVLGASQAANQGANQAAPQQTQQAQTTPTPAPTPAPSEPAPEVPIPTDPVVPPVDPTTDSPTVLDSSSSRTNLIELDVPLLDINLNLSDQ